MCDTAGACQPVPRKGACDDLNQCTEDDQCQGFFCVGTPRPAGAACDLDGHVCTPSPATGCKRPASPQATLQLKSGTKPKQSKLKWKWQKGSQTDLAEFGDPTAATDYTLCIFEPAPYSAPIPLCWSRPKHRRWNLPWPTLLASGSRHRLRLPGQGPNAERHRQDRPQGRARGHRAGPGVGEGREPEHRERGVLAIPWSVQLRASNGMCWESLNGRSKQNGQIDFNHGSPSGAFLD
jgi:hypothetical protein